jgi:hypothetical protein
MVLILSPLTGRAAGGVSWEQWKPLPGVFDVTGPLSGGSLIVAASDGVLRLSPDGTTSPFAAGYKPRAGAEDYLATSAGLAVPGAGCSFPADHVYALRTDAPVGVIDLDATGAHPFATVSGAETLNGIAFDRYGRFGNRLLVTGPHQGKTVVSAVDCAGKVTLVTDSAPPIEGGMEVAPATFGAFGGDLIAPDELSGKIIAITAEGTTLTVAQNGLPSGGDIGAESAGFVPPGFLAGGAAYLADRGTAGNPHAGTDTLLRLSSAQLKAAGVVEGDLLVANEGAGTTVAVHCDAAGDCSHVRPVGQAAPGAHIEGHLLAVADHPSPSPPALPPGKLGSASRSGLQVYLPYAVGLLALGGLFGLYWLRRPSRSRR